MLLSLSPLLFLCLFLLLFPTHSLMNIHPPSPSLCTFTGYVHLYVCLSAFFCLFIVFESSSPNSCMTAFCLVVCLVTRTPCLMGLFGCKCPSVRLSVNPSSPCVYVSICTVSGSAWGGECRPKYHPSGGEGTQSQRQRTGPDALPGRSSAVPVRIYCVTCVSVNDGNSFTNNTSSYLKE